MVTRPRRGHVLRGRRSERRALDRFLGGIRSGQSGALVVCGEPGIGKTALLDYAVERAPDWRVVRAVGVQSEMELAFAGLHQLCAPLLDQLDDLPGPQRAALGTAFGLTEGEAPDRFLIGLAVLGLLAQSSAQEPLLCIVDDAQWLDRASLQALAFVARRVLAEGVALLFGARDPVVDELVGLPELAIGGLGDTDARTLLASAVPGPIDEEVTEAIVAETQGNPLALLELPRGLTPEQLAGGFGLPNALPLAGRIEESYRRRIESLPAATRTLLLLAAAEPTGDALLLRRAAEQLGVDADEGARAAEAGLLELGPRIRFRHPLVRSSVYRSASILARRDTHRALATATDQEADPDRRAWHRAQAAAGPDEEVAAELERSAGRAQARGGLAAAAAFLAEAATLSSDPASRAARALDAAEAKQESGAPSAAQELLALADAGPLDELRQARAERLRGELAFALRRGGDAPRILLEVAKRLEPLDVRLARETYLEAFEAAVFAGRLAGDCGLPEVAAAARSCPRSGGEPTGVDLLLDGLVTRYSEGLAAAMPPLSGALDAFLTDSDLRWLSLACRTAIDLWDDEALEVLALRQERLARTTGALRRLPLALSYLASVHRRAGDLGGALEAIEEADAISAAVGVPRAPYAHVLHLGWAGRESEATAFFERVLEDALPRGEGNAITVVELATATLRNGLGEYGPALVAARSAFEQDEPGSAMATPPEVVEAAVRCGERELAELALGQLTLQANARRSRWGRGIEARSRALLCEGDEAEQLYDDAIEHLSGARTVSDLARARLLYGEWLRREGRRAEAREQLRTAHAAFVALGAEAFAERAARELRATGETARKRTPETAGRLTSQETQIARLAVDGLSNPEIGARLFISPRTVEYHLHKVFAKLDISSRGQLEHALPGSASQDVAQLEPAG